MQINICMVVEITDKQSGHKIYLLCTKDILANTHFPHKLATSINLKNIYMYNMVRMCYNPIRWDVRVALHILDIMRPVVLDYDCTLSPYLTDPLNVGLINFISTRKHNIYLPAAQLTALIFRINSHSINNSITHCIFVRFFSKMFQVPVCQVRKHNLLLNSISFFSEKIQTRI